MSVTIHCTNNSCAERAKCKKGQPMKDGQTVEFIYREVFSECSKFECLSCHFTYVHGESEKQCRKCGAYYYDNFVFSCPWEQHGDVRNA
jgi:hypothetical protein